jgi:hypothetical protein
MGKDFHLKCYELAYDPHQHSRSKHPCTITKRIDATLLRWRGCVVREHVACIHCGEPEALPNDWVVEPIAPG